MILVKFNPNQKFETPQNYDGGVLIAYGKKENVSLNRNRPVEILIIHSQLVCQNDAIQKYKTRVRIPKRFKEFRYEKLYSVCNIVTGKYFQFDSEFFEEYSN